MHRIHWRGHTEVGWSTATHTKVSHCHHGKLHKTFSPPKLQQECQQKITNTTNTATTTTTTQKTTTIVFYQHQHRYSRAVSALLVTSSTTDKNFPPNAKSLDANTLIFIFSDQIPMYMCTALSEDIIHYHNTAAETTRARATESGLLS